jgi:hypothetical protein
MEDPRTSVGVLDAAVWCETRPESAQTRQQWPKPLESGQVWRAESSKRKYTINATKERHHPSRLQIQTSVAPGSK